MAGRGPGRQAAASLWREKKREAEKDQKAKAEAERLEKCASCRACHGLLHPFFVCFHGTAETYLEIMIFPNSFVLKLAALHM